MMRFSLWVLPLRALIIYSLFSWILSCERLPNPDFSFLPREHVEAGDTIWFTNLSKASLDFEWDFGDGNTSNEEAPKHVYEVPGIYEASLTATNSAGEGLSKQTIFVNDPTVLGFIISDSTGTRSLSDAEVWVYTSVLDRDNLAVPLFFGTSDSQGIVNFFNVEPTLYHIWVIKEEESGYWAYKGITTTLKRNRVNLYTVPCIWFAYS
jgi:PKD repeat protein